jgi:hypothetical protein
VKRLTLITFILGAALAIVPAAWAVIPADDGISTTSAPWVPPTGMTPSVARGEALNSQYGLTGVTFRPDILDSRPGVTATATGGSSFDWNTTIGATLGAMVLLAAAATVITRRRHQPLGV